MNFVPIDFVDSVIQTNSRCGLTMNSLKNLSETFRERAEHLANNQIFVCLGINGTFKFTVSGRLNGERIKNMSLDDALKLERFLVGLRFVEFRKMPKDKALFHKVVSICHKFPEVEFYDAYSKFKSLQDANVFLTQLSFTSISARKNGIRKDYLDFLLFQLKNGRLEKVHQVDTELLLNSEKRDDILQAFFESKTCHKMFLIDDGDLNNNLSAIFRLWTLVDASTNPKHLLSSGHHSFEVTNNFENSGYECKINTSGADEADNQIHDYFRGSVRFEAPLTVSDPKMPSNRLRFVADVRIQAGCTNGHFGKCYGFNNGPCDSFKWYVVESFRRTEELVFYADSEYESNREENWVSVNSVSKLESDIDYDIHYELNDDDVGFDLER
ncbi:hypothetical protein L596_026929 [Steinernema carpocapsae]|uniref:Uncharacterized protein n=1 Tax=Steinernema carpocapsae TaxID=34508 RepID=A0A4U5M2T4_STECR|nr:hypothetical protein L596_026929 [Steinernema carpocapsae]